MGSGRMLRCGDEAEQASLAPLSGPHQCEKAAEQQESDAAAKAHRLGAAEAELLIIEGYDGPQP